jgi:membrane fusion protein, multidrug efflux system
MVRSTKVILWCVVAALGAGAAIMAFHHSRHGTSTPAAGVAQTSAVPVVTETVSTADIPVIIRGLGTVAAFNTVSVKSRVVGNVIKINFREGQEVKTGDLLVQLDARPFQAVLDQANASLARDQANLTNAQTDLARYAELLKHFNAPEQQVATQQATVTADEAIVNNDKAVIDAAKLNVDYASIHSPIDGITGIKQVDLGNLVQANSETLVVVTQIKPIYVVFPIPEVDIPRVRRAMGKSKLQVLAYDAADQKPIAQGFLDLVDNQVDQASGTVKLKAEFPNADEALWPGQFVNAHLVVETVTNGITVSSAAVQTGTSGRFVYVVKQNNTVEVRPVIVTQTESNVSLISSGLQVGEKVVTAGQSKLSPGATVVISTDGDDVAAAAPAPSNSPAGAAAR